MKKSYQRQFERGEYIPRNPNKYIGHSNPIFRSSWEKKFFIFCDNNPNITRWASEPVAIPYLYPIDKKMHKYYVDFLIEIREGDRLNKYLIEVKPKSQTQPPKPSKRKKRSTILHEQLTWEKNKAKWEAANAYAKKYGMEFKILTQEELNIKSKKP